MRPPVILMAFANNNDEYLNSLKTERDEIGNILFEKQSQGYYLFDDDTSTLENLRQKLFRYRPQVNILHYAGHANSSQLLFEDQTTYSAGLLESLKTQKNLKLVFLNGCSTKAQKDKLLEIGVPAVIATSVKVNDDTARKFAIEFYQNLNDGKTLKEAFQIASGVKTGKDGLNLTDSKRSLGSLIIGDDDDEDTTDTLAWGLYISPANRDVLDWKLPNKSFYELVLKQGIDIVSSKDNADNNLLLKTLYNVLMTFSEDLEMFAELEKRYGENFDIKDFDVRIVKNAIINSLPSPIGEQVRKLLVSDEDSEDEFPELQRLRFLINTYSVMVDILTFIMLSQLWDELSKKNTENELVIDDELKKLIYQFFNQNASERQGYDSIPLIQDIRQLFEENKIAFFVDEIMQLKVLLADTNGEFTKAYLHFKNIKQKYKDINEASFTENPNEKEIIIDCKETEVQLCNIFKELGFCARYKFATIKDIRIEKKKNRNAIYKHKMVKLDYVLVGFADKNEDFENFTDSNAVIIYKTENRKVQAYNLYPFVIDINALLSEDLSKIYFFSHYTSGNSLQTNCTYRFVKNINRNKDCLQIPLGQDFFNSKRSLKLSEEDTKHVFNETLETIEEFIANFK